jgi:hypothetical protein
MARILRICWGLRAGVFCVLLAACVAHGQDVLPASSASPQTVVDVLHHLSDKAEVIFAGQVMAIRHPNANVVEVEFRVDQAIRGCTAGTPYFAGVGRPVGGRHAALSRRAAHADAVACAERRRDEFAGWWTGWGASDSAKRSCEPGGRCGNSTAAALCRSAVAGSEIAAGGLLS